MEALFSAAVKMWEERKRQYDSELWPSAHGYLEMLSRHCNPREGSAAGAVKKGKG